MSQRHRNQDTAPPPKLDAQAHAHNERHRINSELQAVAAQVSAGYEPDEVHEPGRAWVPPHHHDAEHGEEEWRSRCAAPLEGEGMEAAYHHSQGEGAGNAPGRRTGLITGHPSPPPA